LAIAHEIRRREPASEFLLVGTRTGPERPIAAAEGIPFVAVPSGKLRRYWDLENATDVVRVVGGFFASLPIVRRFRPDVAIGAGGFASVPPLYACAVMRVPVLAHQQDAIPGLANRLLRPVASLFTVALPQTVPHFPPRRTHLRGNPVRPSVLAASADRGFARFGLDPAIPLVVATGGGTGALRLNQIVADASRHLVQTVQIVHITGAGKRAGADAADGRYHAVEFMAEGMPDLLRAAAIVVTRAGMGTLTELSALGAPSIVVPMPGSHQIANARAFETMGAATMLEEGRLDGRRLATAILDLLADGDRRESLRAAMRRALPSDAAARIADDVFDIARHPVPRPAVDSRTADR
jgi:UDP-N-acetylglucosamine--N-acetylmuramyl-(pentapeptide) pyrophosphoryl-undecaprenol N-acetylglucosamine transferase